MKDTARGGGGTGLRGLARGFVGWKALLQGYVLVIHSSNVGLLRRGLNSFRHITLFLVRRWLAVRKKEVGTHEPQASNRRVLR